MYTMCSPCPNSSTVGACSFEWCYTLSCLAAYGEANGEGFGETIGEAVGRLMGRLAGRLAERLVGRLVGRLAGRLVGRLSTVNIFHVKYNLCRLSQYTSAYT